MKHIYAKRAHSCMADLKTALLAFNKESARWEDVQAMQEMSDEVQNYSLFLDSFVARQNARIANLRDEHDPSRGR